MQQSSSYEFNCYSDGACSGNPGPGGWGGYITGKSVTSGKAVPHEFSIWGYEASTTNNRMEMQGAINCLKVLPEGSTVAIYTDSNLVCKGYNEWVKGWLAKNWTNSKGEPVANKDLWIKLLEAAGRHKKVKIIWVKGHADNAGNNKADKLATAAIKSKSSQLFSPFKDTGKQYKEESVKSSLSAPSVLKESEARTAALDIQRHWCGLITAILEQKSMSIEQLAAESGISETELTGILGGSTGVSLYQMTAIGIAVNRKTSIVLGLR